jgi:hypothetical protein
MDARRSFEQLFNRITDAARRWAATLHPRPTEEAAPPIQPLRLLAKAEPIPAEPAEHAIQFAQDWYDRLEFHSRRRMRELGIAAHRIGAYDIDFDFRHAAFFPKERTGGANSPGARINLNSGILNPELLAPRPGGEVATLWAKGRLRDRMDAIIAHEDIEGLRVAAGEETKAAHAVAVAEAPDSPLPIGEGAKRILRAIRECEQGRERGK